MNRLEFATALLFRLREEKAPPLGRYCTLLAIASCGANGGTQSEITASIGQESISSHLERALNAGQIKTTPPPPGQRHGRRYHLTELGLSIVASLTNPQPLATHE